MDSRFPQYTTDYISGVMSLRRPQVESLKILENIVSQIPLQKGINLKDALAKIHEQYPICSDFERTFVSLTFALATGVGKTRLMGAFIAYLYTQHNIRNFFVVAPNTTIYEKLKTDLSVLTSAKYVFRGLGCFPVPPQVVADDDYREKPLDLFDSSIRIFIFNIDKFNKEGVNMKKVNEMIGDSFYQYLSKLPDLVLIMDESHHYRAARGAQALNDLNPILGLELTATPLVAKGSRQIPFRNVVYEYPLSQAIADGYTRTPYAVTRTDINFYNFGDEQLDKLMLTDGITCHENIKRKLSAYAENHEKPVVKPFMLIVCKDTDHAAWVERYVCSDAFRDGMYQNKTVTVHSKQRGAESEANTRLLLDVEKPDNPVEIVIHVNMLKEGWDVNNLYTIVPLRTATSKILREQMVGRGLRLPYGERTGEDEVDAVMLTAHDKFKEIVDEAQKGDSIFKAGHVIKVEEIENEHFETTQLALDINQDETIDFAYQATQIGKSEKTDELLRETDYLLTEKVTAYLTDNPEKTLDGEQSFQIAEKIKAQIIDCKDFGEVFRENEDALSSWIKDQVSQRYRQVIEKFIPIPQIQITDAGIESYGFEDFELDTSVLSHTPIENSLVIQNLIDSEDRQRIKGTAIDFDGYNPMKVILGLLREEPEIDYEKCAGLLFKLIGAACTHYSSRYGTAGMQNIVMMYKRDIAKKIHRQMMQHFRQDNDLVSYEVVGVRRRNLPHNYSSRHRVNLYESPQNTIQSCLFDGIKKGVFSTAKFDSFPELTFARILESDSDVKNWLRPAPNEFNIYYNHGHRYEPDFVVETDQVVYLVEIKGEDRLDDPDVIAKKDRAVGFCELATRWGKANGYKAWRYLFIPSMEVMPNSSFNLLASRFG